MLSINLDEESEKYLVQILKQEEIVVSELIKQLLKERASSLPSSNGSASTPTRRQTILERMGGMPEHLASIGGLSDRDTRKAIIAEHIQARHRARHES